MTPQDAKLIRMAMEISQNFRRRGPDAAAEATAAHIRAFWAPTMRADFVRLALAPDFPEEARAIAERLRS